MTIPGQQFNILDPGLGGAPAAINTPLFLGCCEKGTVNSVYTFSRISDAVAALGQGPLSEAVCTYLGTTGAGGPVLAIRLTATPGVVGTLAGTGVGTMVLSGAPLDAYSVQVVITKAATFALTTPFAQITPAEFIYSLDGGVTFTEPFTIPSGGAYPIVSTGMTLTFAGTTVPSTGDASTWGATNWVVGNAMTGVCTEPVCTTTNLALGVAAAVAAAVDVAFIVLTGELATSSMSGGGGGLATALAAHCGALFNRFQFVRAIAAAGRSVEATAITDYSAFASTRVMVTYGRCAVASRKPINGWGFPDRSILDVVAARAGASLISSDLGRVASGPLEAVISITHDESQNETMDQKRFTTLRTLQGRAGFFITQGKLMSDAGSDYKLWQHGRCMDVACDTAYKAQLPFLNESTRVNANGTIDERDALRFEDPVEAALNVNLMDPNSAAGTPGHVSAVGYHIDRTTNLLASGTMKTSVAIRPRGYIKHIVTELGFTANVGG